MTINSIDDFLGHSGFSGGGRRAYLKNWKKDGSIRIWLHTRQLPVALWAHQFPVRVAMEKDGNSRIAWWTRPHNCWETEDFLKKMYYRDRDTGELTETDPPKKCGLCRFVHWLILEIYDGNIGVEDVLFDLTGATDPKDNLRIHAGGFVGMLKKDKLTEDEIAACSKAGIRFKDAWAQSGVSKLGYTFTVVDDRDVRTGIQIAPQAQGVGDTVKKVIADQRKSLGEDLGNPMITPYCIELTYDEAETNPQKRYAACPIMKAKMTDEIEKLIVKTAPPSLAKHLEKFNQKTTRAFLEEHCKIQDVPWDQIFDVPELIEETTDDEFPPKEGAQDEASSPEATSAPPARRRRQQTPAKAPDEPKPYEGADAIPCEKCDFAMAPDELKCRKCGEEYEDDGSVNPPPKVEPKGDDVPFAKPAKAETTSKKKNRF